jgi:hypothetical protein
VGGVPATALFQPHERPDELSGRMPEAVAVGGASRVVLEEDDVCVSSARASYNSAPLPSRQQHSVARVSIDVQEWHMGSMIGLLRAKAP